MSEQGRELVRPELAETTRNGLRIAFLVLLLVWPCIHLCWSLFFDLNSWKLAGWGMYGSLAPGDRGIAVVLIEDGAPPIEELELGNVASRFRAVTYRASGAEKLDLSAVPEDENHALGALMTRIRVFRSRDDVGEFCDGIASWAPEEMELDSCLLLFSTLRLDIRERLTYNEITAFKVSGEQVVRIGDFNTRDMSLSEILGKSGAGKG